MKNSMKSFNKALKDTGYRIEVEEYQNKHFPKTYYLYDPSGHTHDWAYKLKDLKESVEGVLYSSNYVV